MSARDKLLARSTALLGEIDRVLQPALVLPVGVPASVEECRDPGCECHKIEKKFTVGFPIVISVCQLVEDWREFGTRDPSFYIPDVYLDLIEIAEYDRVPERFLDRFDTSLRSDPAMIIGPSSSPVSNLFSIPQRLNKCWIDGCKSPVEVDDDLGLCQACLERLRREGDEDAADS